jgi:hypothetical protein
MELLCLFLHSLLQTKPAALLILAYFSPFLFVMELFTTVLGSQAVCFL